MRRSKNPYKVPTSQTVQIRIHKDLFSVIQKEQKKQQRICDMKFGKNKYKVPNSFISKVLGRMLK